MNHTPTPWKLISYETTGTEVWSDDEKHVIGRDGIKQGFVLFQGEALDRFNDGDSWLDDYEAYQNVKVIAEGDGTENAPFITACNAHDDLVLAAKDACLLIADLAKTVNINHAEAPTFKRLMKALAKAGAK